MIIYLIVKTCFSQSKIKFDQRLIIHNGLFIMACIDEKTKDGKSKTT